MGDPTVCEGCGFPRRSTCRSFQPSDIVCEERRLLAGDYYCKIMQVGWENRNNRNWLCFNQIPYTCPQCDSFCCMDVQDMVFHKLLDCSNRNR